jgi:hypothetical protein
LRTSYRCPVLFPAKPWVPRRHNTDDGGARGRDKHGHRARSPHRRGATHAGVVELRGLPPRHGAGCRPRRHDSCPVCPRTDRGGVGFSSSTRRYPARQPGSRRTCVRYRARGRRQSGTPGVSQDLDAPPRGRAGGKLRLPHRSPRIARPTCPARRPVGSGVGNTGCSPCLTAVYATDREALEIQGE